MKIPPKVGYIVMVHPFEEGADKATQIYNKGLKVLNPFHYELITTKQPISSGQQASEIANEFQRSNVDAIIIRLATWCSDNLLLDMIAVWDVPIVCWGIPDVDSGSMCGAQQFNAVLKELNKTCRFIYGDKMESMDKLDSFIKVITIRKRLKTLRVGLIGNRTQGMAEVICDENSLREVVGPRVESIGWEDFNKIVKKQESINQVAIKDKMNQLKSIISTISANDNDLKDSVTNYFALKELIQEKRLHTVTAECYPNHMGHLCIAYSLLADEGISCACEADINSAVLMWIMRQLSDEPVHHIDPLTVDESENTIVGSHCGSGSIELAESKLDVEIKNVRLAKNGCCITFPSKPGLVTMANLIGRKGTYRMAIIVGEAVSTTMVFPGNPIKIELPFPIDMFLDLVETGGFGHHWVVAYGDISEELEKLGDFMDIDVLHFNHQAPT